MKGTVNALNEKNHHLESSMRETDKLRDNNGDAMYESSKWQGIMASINSLREGLNK